MPDYSSEWEFENPQTRERVAKPRQGQTEVASFRISTEHLRKIDEIIQSNHDPRLKTRSDVYQDAVWLFLNDWKDNFSDALSGRTLRMLTMEQARNQRHSRDNYLANIDEEIDAGVRGKDGPGLQGWLANLKAEREDSSGSPQDYLDELDNRISRLEGIVRKEIVQ